MDHDRGGLGVGRRARVVARVHATDVCDFERRDDGASLIVHDVDDVFCRFDGAKGLLDPDLTVIVEDFRVSIPEDECGRC